MAAAFGIWLCSPGKWRSREREGMCRPLSSRTGKLHMQVAHDTRVQFRAQTQMRERLQVLNPDARDGDAALWQEYFETVPQNVLLACFERHRISPLSAEAPWSDREWGDKRMTSRPNSRDDAGKLYRISVGAFEIVGIRLEPETVMRVRVLESSEGLQFETVAWDLKGLARVLGPDVLKHVDLSVTGTLRVDRKSPNSTRAEDRERDQAATTEQQRRRERRLRQQGTRGVAVAHGDMLHGSVEIEILLPRPRGAAALIPVAAFEAMGNRVCSTVLERAKSTLLAGLSKDFAAWRARGQ
ncbi:hypothetical protein FVE85_5948 [Porphyridium purpureum]|uniref:DUF1997 domain-containing protein n=1 Tax=Porphyridium purpureum TaxID=35688 RepID=A0A5J4Z6A1_PORPP|nr:hypothetical protein FVE85_5948 [Porphyridium purpureum]|eukprot:POR7929..scf295_1